MLDDVRPLTLSVKVYKITRVFIVQSIYYIRISVSLTQNFSGSLAGFDDEPPSRL